MTTKGLLVLFIDKNYSSGLITAKRLEALGCRSERVSSTTEALNYLNSHEKVPDLILVSLNEPDEQLVRFPETVKTQTKWDKMIPFGVISAQNDETTIKQFLNAGYSDYIIRPIEHEIFMDRIEKLLRLNVTLSTVTFHRPVNDEGLASMKIRIREMNEFGLVALVPTAIPPNIILDVSSPSLEKVLHQTVNARAISCKAAGSEFEVVLSFVGLDAQALRALRQFAMADPKKSA